MKKRVVVVAAVAVVAAGVGFSAWGSSGDDLTCPGITASGIPEYVEGYRGARTPEAALGNQLDEADHVTGEPDDAKGFETVTYRGYDADGELMASVVIEGSDTNWRVSRVDTCE